jgi:DNA-binding transcriptional LysR family regulator
VPPSPALDSGWVPRHNLQAGLTFEHLGAFRSVVAAGSFRRAADELKLSQSAVSQRIKYLESIAGARLFDRRKGGTIRLTEVGNALIALADKALSDLEEFAVALERFRKPTEGVVTIAAGPSFIRYRLLDVARRFSEAYPHVELKLHEGRSPTQVAQLVLTASADLGFFPGIIPDRFLRTIAVMHDSLVWVAAPSHPIHDVDLMSNIESLKRMVFALPPPDSDNRQVVERWAKRHGIALRVFVETSDLDTLKEAAIRGAAVAILPDFVLQEELTTGTLHQVTVDGFPFRRQSSVVADARRPLTAAAGAFAQKAKACLAGPSTQPISQNL